MKDVNKEDWHVFYSFGQDKMFLYHCSLREIRSICWGDTELDKIHLGLL